MQLIAGLLFAIGGASAAGINCRGSANCLGNDGASVKTVQDQVGALISQGGADRKFVTNERIACSKGLKGSFCAFYQNGASGTAQEAFDQLQQLQNRGCKFCGSVRTNPTNAADPGMLTVNFVNDPCCEGNCFCASS